MHVSRQVLREHSDAVRFDMQTGKELAHHQQSSAAFRTAFHIKATYFQKKLCEISVFFPLRNIIRIHLQKLSTQLYILFL